MRTRPLPPPNLPVVPDDRTPMEREQLGGSAATPLPEAVTRPPPQRWRHLHRAALTNWGRFQLNDEHVRRFREALAADIGSAEAFTDDEIRQMAKATINFLLTVTRLDGDERPPLS